MNNKFIYCKNCGRTGHNYKKCQEAITSLGIIAFKIDFNEINKDLKINLDKKIFENDENNENINIIRYNSINYNILEKCKLFNKYIKFLLISRKSSLGFIELMRGHYGTTDRKCVINLFKQMYKNEIELIKNNDFNYLWKHIWQSEIINEITDKDYMYSNGKFNIIKENKILDYCLKNIEPEYKSYEWGFPKGRRLNTEKNIDCAIREFNEETNLTVKDYDLLYNIDSLTENLTGTDKIDYKHIYYLGICDNDTEVSINIDNIQQFKEVGNIGWYTYDKSISMLRDYHIEKKIILNNIYIYISSIIINNI